MVFLFLFVLIPVVELYFMIEVGESVGAFNTVMLVILTAIAGGYFVRLQGFSTMMRMRQLMAKGEAPAIEMIEGVILLACGLMLLLPGFITDGIGFLLLIPPVRKVFVIWLLSRSGRLRASGQVHSTQYYQHSQSQDGEIDVNKHRVIEAETWKKED